MRGLITKRETGLRDYYGKPFYFVRATDMRGEVPETYSKGMEMGPDKTEASIIRFGDTCKAEVRKHRNGTVDYSETILADNETYSSKLKRYLESALAKSAIMQQLLKTDTHAGWKVDTQRRTHMAGGGEEVTGSEYENDYVEYTIELDVRARNIKDAIKEIDKKPAEQLFAEAMRKKRLDEDSDKGNSFRFKTIFLIKVDTVGVPPKFEEPVVREVRSLVEAAQVETLM